MNKVVYALCASPSGFSKIEIKIICISEQNVKTFVYPILFYNTFN